MTELSDLSETDASNTTITGADIAENCQPSSINNAIRNLAGLIKRAFNTTNFRVRDATDQTKLLALNLSGFTTATTRTITVPNGSGTMALLENTQTFSGVKTFSGIPVLSGGGIRFPATQVASSDANTLDDYEEATFTPVVQGSTVAGSATYSAQSGRFTKIGNVVLFNYYVAYSGHTGTGNLLLTGLPFTAGADPVAVSVWMSTLTFTGQVVGFVENSATRVVLYNAGSGLGSSIVTMDAAATILVSGLYYV
jgi:hypothetical protein